MDAPAAGSTPDQPAIRVGDEVYGAEALARFTDRLAGLVRKRLGWRLRRKLDTHDVVQSVFKSFLRLQREQDLAFDTWDALWGLLALMTVRKCGHKIEYFTAARRTIAAEQSAVRHAGTADDDARRCVEALSREPEPVHAAMLSETLTRLLAGLDDRDRRIVTLALEGATTAEISDEIRRSERTVQRVLKRVWAQLEAETG